MTFLVLARPELVPNTGQGSDVIGTSVLPWDFWKPIALVFVLVLALTAADSLGYVVLGDRRRTADGFARRRIGRIGRLPFVLVTARTYPPSAQKNFMRRRKYPS